MTATTTSHLGSALQPCLNRVISYAEVLTNGIDPAKFAHMPMPGVNHPAFCLGHLALYPNLCFTLLGREDLKEELPGFEALFKAGVECVEDDGRYPAKDVIVEAFVDGHRRLADALSEVDDAVFGQINPIEGRMREFFPTIGVAVTFLSTAHPMMHLGQVSAWRRVMGLGSAM